MTISLPLPLFSLPLSPLSLLCRGDHQRLADIFVQKGPYLKMYSTYIRQFDNNVAMLDEQCRKNPGFAAVVREFEVNSCVCVCHRKFLSA
jgi:hypothetical protein